MPVAGDALTEGGDVVGLLVGAELHPARASRATAPPAAQRRRTWDWMALISCSPTASVPAYWPALAKTWLMTAAMSSVPGCRSASVFLMASSSTVKLPFL